MATTEKIIGKDGTGSLVTHNDDGTLTVQAIKKDGTPIGNPASIPAGFTPAVDGNGYIRGYTDPNGIEVGDPTKAVINKDGSIVYPDGVGGTLTSYPDGSQVARNSGITTTWDANGNRSVIKDSTGQAATAADVQAVNDKNGAIDWKSVARTGLESLKTESEKANLVKILTGQDAPGFNNNTINRIIDRGLGGDGTTFGGEPIPGTVTGPGGSGGAADPATQGAIADAAAMNKMFLDAYNNAKTNPSPQAQAALATAIQAVGSSPVAAAMMTPAQIGAYQEAQKTGPIAYGSVTGAHSTAAVSDPSVKAALATYDDANQLGGRAQQDQLIAGLNDAIAGKDPSVAAILLRQATDRNIANQYALAASAHDMNSGLAMRQAMIGSADLNAKAAADNALLRAKEIVDARAQLADVLGTQRTQDISVATTKFNAEQGVNSDYAKAQNDRSALNAQLLNTTNINNAQNDTNAAVATARNLTDANTTAATLANAIEQTNANNRTSLAEKQAELNQEASKVNAGAINQTNQFNAGQVQDINKFNAGQTNDINKSNASNQTSVNQSNVTAGLTQQQIDALQKQNAAKNALDASGQVIQGNTAAANTAVDWNKLKIEQEKADNELITGGATAIAKSDREAKKNVKPSEKEIGDLLSSLRGYRFEYKDPHSTGAAEGERFGVMAQDLEKSRAGRSLVRDTEEGKMVDTNQAVMTALAALAQMDKRMSRVERRA